MKRECLKSVIRNLRTPRKWVASSPACIL